MKTAFFYLTKPSHVREVLTLMNSLCGEGIQVYGDEFFVEWVSGLGVTVPPFSEAPKDSSLVLCLIDSENTHVSSVLEQFEKEDPFFVDVTAILQPSNFELLMLCMASDPKEAVRVDELVSSSSDTVGSATAGFKAALRDHLVTVTGNLPVIQKAIRGIEEKEEALQGICTNGILRGDLGLHFKRLAGEGSSPFLSAWSRKLVATPG